MDMYLVVPLKKSVLQIACRSTQANWDNVDNYSAENVLFKFRNCVSWRKTWYCHYVSVLQSKCKHLQLKTPLDSINHCHRILIGSLFCDNLVNGDCMPIKHVQQLNASIHWITENTTGFQHIYISSFLAAASSHSQKFHPFWHCLVQLTEKLNLLAGRSLEQGIHRNYVLCSTKETWKYRNVKAHLRCDTVSAKWCHTTERKRNGWERDFHLTVKFIELWVKLCIFHTTRE